jgi:RNA polymerase sigma-70 factor (ECF subfamily)
MPLPPDTADADELWLQAEERLVERAKAGETDALRPIFERYAAPLYAGVILPRLGDPTAAEDVLRDTFVAALEKLGSFTWQGRGLFGWLRQIAVNKIIDRHRRSSASGRALEAYAVELETTVAQPQRPDDALADAEEQVARRARVSQALEQLSSRYRQAIELRLVEERSREACAQALGITVGNFDVVLFRAIRAFRKVWAAGPDEAEASDG